MEVAKWIVGHPGQPVPEGHVAKFFKTAYNIIAIIEKAEQLYRDFALQSKRIQRRLLYSSYGRICIQ